MKAKKNIDYYDILYDAKKVLPLLSEKEIKIIMIQAIYAYLSNTISLTKLSKISLLIKIYYSNYPNLSYDLRNDLEEIKSMYSIEEILVDILSEMIENKEFT